MFETTAIIIMAVIIIALLVERFFYSREMNRQIRDNTAAIMSRNINDYLAARETDKKPRYTTSPEMDDVLETEMPDAEFFKHIENAQ